MYINIKNIEKKLLYFFKYNILMTVFIFFISYSMLNENHFIKSNNNELYNKIYYQLNIEYTHFLKKVSRLNEEFLFRLLKKETINPEETNKKILISKESYDFRNIFKILKILLNIIKHNFNALVNTENLEHFINIIDKELENHKPIKQAFKKALYIITGNEAAYNAINSINITPVNFDPKILNDDCLLTLFWILYRYEEFSNIFDLPQIDQNSLANEEIFVYTYPLYINSLHKTFNEIKLNETLIKYFSPFLMTEEGLSNLINNEKYNKACNEKMAFHLIQNQKIQLMKLLLDTNNRLFLEKINSLMKKIAACSEELIALKQGKSSSHWLFNFFGVTDLPIENYLIEYIPLNIFGSWIPMWHGVNSHKAAYIINSAIKFYESAAGSTLQRLWMYNNKSIDTKNLENTAYSSFFNNSLTSTLLPIAGFWPGMSFNPDKLIAQARPGTDPKEFFWHNKAIYTIKDSIHQYKHATGVTGFIFNLLPGSATIFGAAAHITLTAIAVRAQYYSIKSILNQIKNTKNHSKYFFTLKRMILYSKQLLKIFIQLYADNNINDDCMIPEIIHMQDILTNKAENGLLNKILSWSNKRIDIWAKNIYNFFSPGNMAHFYFKELYESIEIDILNNYIGAIDIVLAKLKLLDLQKQFPELTFSIPVLLNPAENKNAVFKTKKMWFPSLRGNPVKNSIELEKNTRNMMLVSPVAGGKTVLLSTILTQLYLANMGISATEEMEYTYFTNIIDHMHHDYDIGSGLSQHLAERKSMHMVKSIAAHQKENQKSIIIIDEIYKGTIPQLAVKEALMDLPPILKKENIITIVTTHFPEITEITKNKELSIDLYYLLVDHVAGIFNRTHRLFKDDEYNWWIRNQELGLKYQLSQDIQ